MPLALTVPQASGWMLAMSTLTRLTNKHSLCYLLDARAYGLEYTAHCILQMPLFLQWPPWPRHSCHSDFTQMRKVLRSRIHVPVCLTRSAVPYTPLHQAVCPPAAGGPQTCGHKLSKEGRSWMSAASRQETKKNRERC